MFHFALALAIVILDTPTPTPTPTPGPVNNPISSFYVDKNQPLPWDVLLMPTWGTGTPPATLYASTPPHATDYPEQLSTATAQILTFTAPVNSASTPVAAIAGIAPTESGGDVSTGLDPIGAGTISVVSFTDTLNTQITEVVGAGRAFVLGLYNLSGYSAWLAPLLVISVATAIIDMWVMMIVLFIRNISWLFDLIMKILVLVGLWKPG